MNGNVRDVLVDAPAALPLPARLLVAWLARMHSGRLEGQLDDGNGFLIQAPRPGPGGVLCLHAPWRLLPRLLARGAVGFAEGYMAGDWSSPDPAALLTVLALNEDALETRSRAPLPVRLALRRFHDRRRNSRRGSRRNIAAHYDLGNAFYRLWLDETMTYSGAEFAHPDQPLAAAQRHKYRCILDRLDVRSGERLLEIGCGWGAFALEAAMRGAHVTGITLSREQRDWARRRVAEAGLKQQVEIRLQDYRDAGGEFDHIVSIEMVEAVGRRYWPIYFDTLAARLRPGGRAVLHGIVIDENRFAAYQAHPDFIQRYIFPGGMLPTPGHLRKQARQAGLTVTTEETLGADYALTLAEWRRRFLAGADAVRRLGFDERFLRMWSYYLAYCEAGFRTHRVDLLRLVLRRPEA